jgi:hypothetical protein
MVLILSFSCLVHHSVQTSGVNSTILRDDSIIEYLMSLLDNDGNFVEAGFDVELNCSQNACNRASSSSKVGNSSTACMLPTSWQTSEVKEFTTIMRRSSGSNTVPRYFFKNVIPPCLVGYMKINNPESSESSVNRSERSDLPLVGSKRSINSDEEAGGMYLSVMDICTLEGGTAGRGWVIGAALGIELFPL